MNNPPACRQCGCPLDAHDTVKNGLCKNCTELQAKPDDLSKRTELGGVPFQDMKHLDEDQRIALIISNLQESPDTQIAVIVDTILGFEDKGDRYIRKVRASLPTVQIKARRPGPGLGSEMIVFHLPPTPH